MSRRTAPIQIIQTIVAPSSRPRPWEDPGHDSLRPDKKRIPLPTDEEMFAATIKVARRMLQDFGWKEWMWQFINRDGSARPYQKGMVT